MSQQVGYHSTMQCHIILLHILIFLSFVPGFSCSTILEAKILLVGHELWKETLPLQMGFRSYQLEGLKPYTWYEVKISYPASIPARFSLQLKKGNSELKINLNRKLQNTEKLIFKTENMSSLIKFYALVTVESEGVIAIPNVSVKKYIIFNIVCDELLLGIPHEAWWVGAAVLFCLVLAMFIPHLLPPSFLLSLVTNQIGPSVGQNAAKDT